MSDKPKDEKPSTRVDEEPPAPKPLTDEQTYGDVRPNTDPRVTHPAETEEQMKKREEDAKSGQQQQTQRSPSGGAIPSSAQAASGGSDKSKSS